MDESVPGSEREKKPLQVVGFGALAAVAFLIQGVLVVGLFAAADLVRDHALMKLQSKSAERLMLHNCAALVRPSTPEEAAIMVVRRYESPGEAAYRARPDREAATPGSKDLHFLVSRNGIDVAKVKLVPYLDLGWQEGCYERIGGCCPSSSP